MQEKNKKETEVKAKPLAVIFKHTLLKCDRCSKEFEADVLVNIAFSQPYSYTICGRCNSMPRAKRRAILNQIIQKVQDDNCD